MTNASTLFLAAVGAFLQCSCCFQHASYYRSAQSDVSAKEINAVLTQHPIERSQNILVTPLASLPSVSHHLVQVRHSESLHIHRDHDLTVFVYRGRGRMRIGERVIIVHEGDVLLVPRGVPHAFENTAPRPSVAIAVFTPSFDGKDTVQK